MSCVTCKRSALNRSLVGFIKYFVNPTQEIRKECTQWSVDGTYNHCGSIRDDSYWAFRENSLELIELYI